MSNAKEFIEENYPVTADTFKDGRCFGLNDVSYICEMYHQSKLKNNGGLGDVSGSDIRPLLGLMPKKFHNERVKVERFNEVCGAIARYYDAGLKINIEWIEEYNELVECVGKHYR